jgi:hypothetical protein
MRDEDDLPPYRAVLVVTTKESGRHSDRGQAVLADAIPDVLAARNAQPGKGSAAAIGATVITTHACSTRRGPRLTHTLRPGPDVPGGGAVPAGVRERDHDGARTPGTVPRGDPASRREPAIQVGHVTGGIRAERPPPER